MAASVETVEQVESLAERYKHSLSPTLDGNGSKV